jgi:plasmid replication initiation protein
MADGTLPENSHLSRDRHPQLDLFIADLFDPGASIKDDQASMENPIFALKPGDMRQITYEYSNKKIAVECGPHGRATIHDKDLWIYAISQLMKERNAGNPIGRQINFVAYDFLVTTNRPTNNLGYNRLRDALRRLHQTTIRTSIHTGSQPSEEGFHLIEHYHIERDDGRRMVSITMTLPDWLMNSIIMGEVLTISRDYFRIRKPLDRRIYELARKHCGKQTEWRIGLDKLHQKTGSTATLRNFRIAVRSLVESNDLPSYRVTFDADTDVVSFYLRSTKAAMKQLQRQLSGA